MMIFNAFRVSWIVFLDYRQKFISIGQAQLENDFNFRNVFDLYHNWKGTIHECQEIQGNVCYKIEMEPTNASILPDEFDIDEHNIP